MLIAFYATRKWWETHIEITMCSLLNSTNHCENSSSCLPKSFDWKCGGVFRKNISAKYATKDRIVFGATLAVYMSESLFLYESLTISKETNIEITHLGLCNMLKNTMGSTWTCNLAVYYRISNLQSEFTLKNVHIYRVIRVNVCIGKIYDGNFLGWLTFAPLSCSFCSVLLIAVTLVALSNRD